jgi:hypothetical protein
MRYFSTNNLFALASFALLLGSRSSSCYSKIIVDFTGLMITRSPNEMGGLYFSVNAIMSQLLLWGSIMLYIEEMKLGEEGDANETTSGHFRTLTEETLLWGGQAISLVWIVSVAVFFMTCKRDFVGSFISTATASTFAKECWDWQMKQEEIADEVIVKVFSKHPSTFSHFEGEIGEFVSDNWERWNHEKPKFFTKKFIASIPFSVLGESIREEIIVNDLHEKQMEERRLTKARRSSEVSLKWKTAVGRVIRKSNDAENNGIPIDW